ncbi:MAG: hypothetical protein ACI9TA_000582, partial [Reinekea sp.]
RAFKVHFHDLQRFPSGDSNSSSCAHHIFSPSLVWGRVCEIRGIFNLPFAMRGTKDVFCYLAKHHLARAILIA